MDCEHVCTFLSSFLNQAFWSWIPRASLWLVLAGCLVLPTWAVTRLQPLFSPKPPPPQPPSTLFALWLCCNQKLTKLAQWLTSAPQKNRCKNAKLSEQLYFVAIDLIFPAILGTIIYGTAHNGLPDTQTLQPWLLIALKLSIISHYCYDFIYIKKKYHKENYRYSVWGFFLDFLDAVLTYCAAKAICLEKMTVDLGQVGAVYFLTYLLFVLWDLTQNEHQEAIRWDTRFAMAFLALSAAAYAFHPADGYAGSCENFITLVLAVTIFAGTMKFAHTINQLK